MAQVKTYVAVADGSSKVLLKRYVCFRSREEETDLPAGVRKGLFAPLVQEIDMVRFLAKSYQTANRWNAHLVSLLEVRHKQRSIVVV